VLGLFLSLVLLQIISIGFNLLGISPHLTEAIWGATMILAIARWPTSGCSEPRSNLPFL
jgi:ribose/xylose/arabinose/galactoside ABC-type transport system permease subunit